MLLFVFRWLRHLPRLPLLPSPGSTYPPVDYRQQAQRRQGATVALACPERFAGLPRSPREPQRYPQLFEQLPSALLDEVYRISWCGIAWPVSSVYHAHNLSMPERRAAVTYNPARHLDYLREIAIPLRRLPCHVSDQAAGTMAGWSHRSAGQRSVISSSSRVGSMAVPYGADRQSHRLYVSACRTNGTRTSSTPIS